MLLNHYVNCTSSTSSARRSGIDQREDQVAPGCSGCHIFIPSERSHHMKKQTPPVETESWDYAGNARAVALEHFNQSQRNDLLNFVPESRFRVKPKRDALNTSQRSSNRSFFGMSVINKDQNYAIADVNTLEINVVSWLKPSNGRLDFMLLGLHD